MNFASKSINSTIFTLHINATFNNKAKVANMLIKFNTSESELVNVLLAKYRLEKLSTIGQNINNQILSVILGDKCIVITCPDEKVSHNIVLLLSYLSKTSVKNVNGSFDKMFDGDIEINVGGKCKKFMQILNNVEQPDVFENVIDSIELKGNVEGTGNIDTVVKKSVVFNTTTDIFKMYLSIVLQDIACTFEQSGDELKVSFLSDTDVSKYEELVRCKERVILQTRIRSFLTQSGTIGTPAANDKGQVHFKRKVQNILASENALAKIYANLRGFDFTFNNEDELIIDNSVITLIMRALH